MRIIIMATKRSSRLTWLVALIAAAGIAAGSWYAYSHGWLTHAYAWLGHSASKDQAPKSDEEEMVDMPGMPGMKMPVLGSSVIEGGPVPAKMSPTWLIPKTRVLKLRVRASLVATRTVPLVPLMRPNV